MSVRQSLPVKIRHRDASRRETLPWTLEAENIAVYSVHVKKSLSLTGEDYRPVVHYLLSKVSSTAVLASARTSSVPSSPPLAPPQFLKPSSAGGRRVSTLGFCVHTDFQPIEVSFSRKQVGICRVVLDNNLSFQIAGDVKSKCCFCLHIIFHRWNLLPTWWRVSCQLASQSRPLALPLTPLPVQLAQFQRLPAQISNGQCR